MLEKATPNMNEVEQFLQDTEQDNKKVDVLDAPLIPEEAEKPKEGEAATEGEGKQKEGESEEVKPRNRRERRLATALAAERESSSFLAGKLAARTEAQGTLSEEKDYLKMVERIYGTDTPEAQLATDLLKKAITGARDDAENRAFERMKEERGKEAEAQKKAEGELDDMLEEIEDEYDVTLTEPQEKAFFQLLEKMSPKDKEGNVTEYADAHAVWEVFAEKLKTRSSSDTRAKDMSSRSMTQSGASRESNLNDDVTARFLKDQGII